jgi:hypothetical protein
MQNVVELSEVMAHARGFSMLPNPLVTQVVCEITANVMHLVQSVKSRTRDWSIIDLASNVEIHVALFNNALFVTFPNKATIQCDICVGDVDEVIKQAQNMIHDISKDIPGETNDKFLYNY